jgi:hypothetical protein
MDSVVSDIILCECWSVDHQIVITYDKEDEDKTAYVSIHLCNGTFIQRLKYAIKYLFGLKSRYGAFDEIILGSSSIKKLEDLVNFLKK